MREIILVGIGGFIGAILRYVLSSFIQNDNSTFPTGTLIVNFVGTLLLGLVVYSAEHFEFISMDMRLFLSIGVLGAFTTMSTFGLETFRMFESENYLLLFMYIVGTVTLVFAGMLIAKSTVEWFGVSALATNG